METLEERNERIWSSHLSTNLPDSGCRIWIGAVQRKARGPLTNQTVREIPVFQLKLGVNRYKIVSARRFAYECFVLGGEQIPHGYDVINVCGDDRCVVAMDGHNELRKHGEWKG